MITPFNPFNYFNANRNKITMDQIYTLALQDNEDADDSSQSDEDNSDILSGDTSTSTWGSGWDGEGNE